MSNLPIKRVNSTELKRDGIDYGACMSRALELASQVISTAPNPRVGCVLVNRSKQIFSEGWHKAAGQPHAEAMALELARQQGANDFSEVTAVVTLEPCSHVGRTPPCSDALIEAGVARVVFASLDPNPDVAGAGVIKLAAAGIEVIQLTDFDEAAKNLNPGYFRRHELGLPYVKCKLAMSMDGRTAMASGESKWITGAAARADVQRLRAESCAVVTGVETVLLDNPGLNVRQQELAFDESELQHNRLALLRQPMRVVLDSQLRTPADARIFAAQGAVRIFTGSSIKAATVDRFPDNVAISQVAGSGQRVALPSVLECLARDHSCNQILIEAGPTLSGAFVQAGLVDELIVYVAPKLLGSDARPLLQLPGLSNMSDQIGLEIKDLNQIGDDFRVRLAVKKLSDWLLLSMQDWNTSKCIATINMDY